MPSGGSQRPPEWLLTPSGTPGTQMLTFSRKIDFLKLVVKFNFSYGNSIVRLSPNLFSEPTVFEQAYVTTNKVGEKRRVYPIVKKTKRVYFI